jgi:hypothetical protein
MSSKRANFIQVKVDNSSQKYLDVRKYKNRSEDGMLALKTYHKTEVRGLIQDSS